MQVLDSFTSTFDFAGLSFDAGLRTFLECFKLPGEAQKIDRVINCFGRAYYKHAPDLFANEDAVYILAYSIIMLNTDRHNNQVSGVALWYLLLVEQHSGVKALPSILHVLRNAHPSQSPGHCSNLCFLGTCSGSTFVGQMQWQHVCRAEKQWISACDQTAVVSVCLQVKKKMEESEFCRNLRGVNEGKDFPKPFLSAIYHSICKGRDTYHKTSMVVV